jgi:DNA-binding MarR family transcriptional regulator
VTQNAEGLRRAVHSFIRRFGLLDEARTPCGMAVPLSQAHAMMELLRTPRISQQDLADRLALSKSNVSRLVDRLVASGRVRRERDMEDGRACRLVLTEKGRHLARELDQRSLGRFEALLRGVPPRERNTVIRALSLLVEATDDHEGSSP